METKLADSQWTDERVLEIVRKLRNDLIKDFLDDRHLRHYLQNEYRVHDLSPVKIEFIRRDLKELLIAPVNTNHYEPLINHIRATDSAALTENNEKLFYRELDEIFKKYIY